MPEIPQLISQIFLTILWIPINRQKDLELKIETTDGGKAFFFKYIRGKSHNVYILMERTRVKGNLGGNNIEEKKKS